MSKPEPNYPPKSQSNKSGRWVQALRARTQRLENLLWSSSVRPCFTSLQRWGQILERSLIGFLKNRGAANASALTYTSLLTLVPLLAVVVPVLKGFHVYENAHRAIMRFVDDPQLQDKTDKNLSNASDPLVREMIHQLEITTSSLMLTLGNQVNIKPPDSAKMRIEYIFIPAPTDLAQRPMIEAKIREMTELSNSDEQFNAIARALTGRESPWQQVVLRANDPKFDRNLFDYLMNQPPGTLSKSIAGRNGWLIFKVLNRSDPLRASIHDFIDKIFIIVNSTDLKNLGYFGLAGLLFAVMSLLSKIELSMNDAWSIYRSRSWSRKFFDYMNLLIIFLMMIIALSATTTSSIIQFKGAWERLGLNYLQKIVLELLPFAIIWLAFITLYKFMPNTHVRWGSAIAGGLIAGLFFQLVQIGLMRTHLLLERYNKIYGVFAILVIVLVMVYVSWCIILWGVWVCSVHQNLRDWRRRRRPWNNLPAERETLALRLAVLLANPLLNTTDGHRMDTGELADTLCLPTAPVAEIIELFRQHGLAIQALEDEGWMLARAPEKISALDVLRLIRQGSLNDSHAEPNPRLQGEDQLRNSLGRWNIQELTTLPLESIQTVQI